MTIEELKALVLSDNRENWAAPESSDSAFTLWELRNEILALVEASNALNSEVACYSTHVGPVLDALDAFNAKLEKL